MCAANTRRVTIAFQHATPPAATISRSDDTPLLIARRARRCRIPLGHHAFIIVLSDIDFRRHRLACPPMQVRARNARRFFRSFDAALGRRRRVSLSRENVRSSVRSDDCSARPLERCYALYSSCSIFLYLLPRAIRRLRRNDHGRNLVDLQLGLRNFCNLLLHRYASRQRINLFRDEYEAASK